jgi:hypothetical protein
MPDLIAELKLPQFTHVVPLLVHSLRHAIF